MSEAVTPPLVSVVIPTYNQAAFIGEALQSLIDQTHGNWEAIVINNYSDDDTVAVVDAFRDPRIQRVDFHNHGVIAASRNLGLSLAKGNFIAFLDSDDAWYPEKLDTCVRVLEGGAELVGHAEDWLTPDGRRRLVRYGPPSRARYESLLYRGNCLSTSAVVVTRQRLQAAGGFRETPAFITAEDYDLWLRLAQAGTTMAIVDEGLGFYRIHAASSSKSVARHRDAVLAVLASHWPRHQAGGQWPRVRRLRRIAQEHYVAGRGYLAAGDVREARHCFQRALAVYPLSTHGLVGMGLVALCTARRLLP